MDLVMEPYVENMYNKLKSVYNFVLPTGSYFMCNPRVTNTDIDFVCYGYKVSVNTNIFRLFEYTGVDYGNRNEEMFFTYRYLNFNLIEVLNYSFFLRWKLATEECTKRNLLNKEDRIKLFDDVFRNPKKYEEKKFEITWV